jgi:AraC-like DNA-binding protein
MALGPEQSSKRHPRKILSLGPLFSKEADFARQRALRQGYSGSRHFEGFRLDGTHQGRRVDRAVTIRGMLAKKHPTLVETTVDGPGTSRWVVEGSQCQELNLYRIARLGIDEAVAPYQRVRLRPQGSFLLASMEGEGRMLLDGKWHTVKPDSLFMAPPRVLNAFYAVPGRPWRFAWLRYAEPEYVRPMVGASSPVRAAGGGGELARCIAGLRAEWQSGQDPKIIHHWVSLIQAMATRASEPIALDDKLAALWAKVGSQLGKAWSLDLLCREVHGSGEYLRLRCQKEMGRSPMQQVTYMRMQRAQSRLETSHDTVESIALELGFSDGLAFSRAFKRWIGSSPSEYRQRH